MVMRGQVRCGRDNSADRARPAILCIHNDDGPIAYAGVGGNGWIPPYDFAVKSQIEHKFEAREAAMESIISNLVARFEQGSLNRRDLVRGLAMLAASGTTVAAQEDLNFKAATIDHVSLQVADLQRSVDFYQKIFGFSVVSEERSRSIMRLGNGRTLVSLNRESPTGIVDHFAIGIPRFNKDFAVR